MRFAMTIAYRGRLVIPACESRLLTVATDAGFVLQRLHVKLGKKHAVLVSQVVQRGREVDLNFVNTTAFARALSFVIEGSS